MRLRTGDVLVKKRGGGNRRMEVSAHRKTVDGWCVELHALAPSVQARPRDKVSSVILPLGDDGLPEGYRRAES